MSPQFVDWNADGHLDIVAGTFDGSPHVAFGSARGYRQPEQILDRAGARVVGNQFWNFDSKKWDSTKRCDPAGYAGPESHLTSAWAFDQDGDGDLDLLLGDHSTGNVWLRRNEGTATTPALATANELVLADGKPLDVPGTVATLQLVDWNGDGRRDLVCGGMGDAYGDGPGGGVFVYPDTGKGKAATFGPRVTLVEASSKPEADGPVRPDSGLHMDLADADGDGDLDLLVGGYSHWSTKAPELTPAQEARVAELKQAIAALTKASAKLNEALSAATENLPEAEADRKRGEILAAQKDERAAIGKRRQALQEELDPLVPGKKRVSYVWLYENVATTAGPATPGAPR